MAIRVVALAMAFATALGAVPTLAQTGVIGGKATDEAQPPYANYAVQLRVAATGQVVTTMPLDPQGGFTFNNVAFNQQLLVELVNTQSKRTVCSEGPFAVSSAAPSRTNVNIDCGKVPAAFWILAAGAGTAAAVGLATRDSDTGDSGPTPTPAQFSSTQSPSR